MTFFGSSHWLFSVKTFVAAMLALAVSFWLDLPRPYWALASVYIASQPLAGATMSKAVYRAAGTLIGAAGAVLMVPNLVDAPLVLALAMSIWSGFCLYLALLDRTPRGYVFMLAGYTAAIVGFPAVDAPSTVFDLALSRTEEILVGIACASLVSSLVFPRSVGAVVAERLDISLRHGRDAAGDALDPQTSAPNDAHWLRLVTDVAEIETLAAHLSFDPAVERRSLDRIRRITPRMLMLFPVLSAISDRLAALADLGGASERVGALVERARAVVVGAEDSEKTTAELRRDLESAAAASADADWRALIEASLCQRIGELLDILFDCGELTKALADGSVQPAPLRLTVESRVARVRHLDHGAALHAAFALGCAIFACCLFWIATAWPEGSVAAMMGAIVGSLYASQDDPTPSIAGFAKWTIVATTIAGVYLFVILPRIHNFETLALALAPVYLAFGLLIASPQTFRIGLPLAIVTPTAMAVQELYSADAENFVNTSLAMSAGMALTAVTTALIRRAGAQWRARRYARANRDALVQAADPRAGNDVRLMGLMLDRLFLLAPIAHAVEGKLPDALRDLRTGLNILDARRSRNTLVGSRRRRIDALLKHLTRSFQIGAPAPSRAALHAIDRAMAMARNAGDARLLLALVGLRRCLFAAEPPPDQSLLEAKVA
ncbi:putative membrane protein YccC [Methylosinus sp. sav-2]|uniref:FUSC family protein n=1 Tax=Methylosinus sp. sav-2 TaxID=2485168 RepID=UPI00047B469E|nr:FUSC family protein [Methylosinus sp. sav-2]TDX61160.1 putative membrane protein YccC [Methylosinus sp. sav-2]